MQTRYYPGTDIYAPAVGGMRNALTHQNVRRFLHPASKKQNPQAISVAHETEIRRRRHFIPFALHLALGTDKERPVVQHPPNRG